jgi:hypothetical protein
MTDLLAAVLDAHGGRDRWNRVARLEVSASLGGPFWASKGWPDVYRDQAIEVDARRFDIAFSPYPAAGQRSRMVTLDGGGSGAAPAERLQILDAAGAVLETRDDPRRSFPDPASRPEWDAIQTAYFTSCACWNYFTEPFVFTCPGVEVEELAPWIEGDETWRRLAVTFPPDLPNHNPRQTFYYDDRFLLRRMDYHPEVTDSPIAHYTDEHREFGGLVFPTRRRVHVHDADGRANLDATPITVDVDDIRVIEVDR